MHVAIDRAARAFLVAAGIFTLAGGSIAAVDSGAPFDHGAWLAAFLVLVGGVAQALLGAGRLTIGAPRPSRSLWRGQLALWNSGTVAVAAGVLAGAPALVTAGGVALLCALALLAGAVNHAPRTPRALAYAALIAGLAVSVVVGSALADAAPGGWL